MNIQKHSKPFFLILFTWLYLVLPFSHANNPPVFFSDDELKERILNMYCLVPTIIDDDVMDQVKRYIQLDRSSSKVILARSEKYFSLMDKILLENDLPSELKFLTIVESSLNPGAKSYMGAAGLWQFMSATGKSRGLRIDDKVDQRLDAIQSTLAAINYFKFLHEKFGDWSLVLAAYNAGENKVQKLVNEKKAKNFWDIKKFLPRETQQFIPAFIGVSYLMQYYWEHDLTPGIEVYAAEKITFAKIYANIHVKDMLKKTGIPADIFEQYNPAFKRTIIPISESGNTIALPDGLMIEFVEYYLGQHFAGVWDSQFKEGESDAFKKLPEIISFTRPYFFYPEDIMEKAAKDNQIQYAESTSVSINDIPPIEIKEESKMPVHLVRKRESLQDIATQYEGVTVQDLIQWNTIAKANSLEAGTVLWIRK